jgi:CBS domain-containing protein
MTSNTISQLALRPPCLLRTADTVEQAVQRLLETDLPALPAVDGRDQYAGIFGEREFMRALFPAYLEQLRGTAYLRRSLDETLQTRDSCRTETVARHLNTEHIDVGPDFSDTQIAEIFLHHRVLIVPVVVDRHVTGIITRHGFFRTVAERFLH